MQSSAQTFFGRSLLGLAAAAIVASASSAQAQVFYPVQPLPVLPATGAKPSPYLVDDGLDVTLEMEAFTTNWGEGYSGLSYGAGIDVDLSPNLVLELDGSRLDTTLGSAYQYGAGLNLYGDRGELYAAINGITASPDSGVGDDMTWVEIGGEYQVTERLRFGFEASTTVDSALVPYDSIYTPNALNQSR